MVFIAVEFALPFRQLPKLFVRNLANHNLTLSLTHFIFQNKHFFGAILYGIRILLIILTVVNGSNLLIDGLLEVIVYLSIHQTLFFLDCLCPIFKYFFF